MAQQLTVSLVRSVAGGARQVRLGVGDIVVTLSIDWATKLGVQLIEIAAVGAPRKRRRRRPTRRGWCRVDRRVGLPGARRSHVPGLDTYHQTVTHARTKPPRSVGAARR